MSHPVYSTLSKHHENIESLYFPSSVYGFSQAIHCKMFVFKLEMQQNEDYVPSISLNVYWAWEILFLPPTFPSLLPFLPHCSSPLPSPLLYLLKVL